MFDTHTHISEQGLEKDIQKYLDAGVTHMMLPAIDSSNWDAVIRISREHKEVYGALGVHPNSVANEKRSVLDELERKIHMQKIKAVGEIGLDYYRSENKEEQIEWLSTQLEIAKAANLPVIIHDREAHQDTMEVLDFINSYETGVILHSYSGSVEMAKEYVKRGAYLSFSGPITFKNARVPKEVAKSIPLEHILVETDSPWLSPEPFRGKKNDPSKVRFILAQIASLREMSFEEIEKITTENAKRVFHIED